MSVTFVYEAAFNRNIGWFTQEEQQILRGKRVAVGGLGGCGGVHVTTLARAGIGRFNLADFDRFEIANFNRQVGARVSTIGRPKLEVMKEMALDINPELKINAFPQGILEDQIDAFLDGADVFVDAIDAFTLDIRRKVYARCRTLGIPAVFAVPAGMGAAFLIFDPNGMSFEDWFCFDDVEPAKRMVNFIVGIAPEAVHSAYLVDPSRINLETREFPSTGLACELCAGVTAAQVVKLLLKRGEVEAVPTYHQFDAFACVYKKGQLDLGNRTPAQKTRLEAAYIQFAELSAQATGRRARA